MKAVIFTTSFHVGANIAIREVLKSEKVNVVGIVQAKMGSFSLSTFQRFGKFIKKSGIVYAVQTTFLAIWQQFSMQFFRFFFPKAKKRKYITLEEMAGEKKIPIFVTEDINSPEVREFIKKQKGNIGVSILLMQKAEKELLDFPEHGCINLHPGLLPHYKGTFMHFWPIHNREKWSGVTVHKMTENFDDGKILGVKKVKIRRKYSQQCLMEESAKVGGKLLVKILKKLQRRESISVQLSSLKKKFSFFSYPTQKAVGRFQKLGKRFSKWNHFFRR